MVEAQQDDEGNHEGQEGEPTAAWDGSPLLSEEEVKRQEQLFTALQDDMWEWQKKFTDAEREAHNEFMREMSEPEDQGGREKREAHQKKIDDAWDEIACGSEIIDKE